MSILEDYDLIDGVRCMYEVKSYNTLSEALDHCSSDVKCVAIKDDSCDNLNTFSGCYMGFRTTIHETYLVDCYYKKAEGYGKRMILV